MKVDNLPIKAWAKTVAIDNDIVDELDKASINVVYPKAKIKLEDWKITKILIYTSPLKRKVLVFYGEVEIDGKVYTERIRLYSPHLPRVKDLEQYLGATIVGGNFICSIITNNQRILVANYIQVIKTDGLKSNPVTKPIEKSSKLLEKPITLTVNDFEDHDQMNDKMFLERYFPNRDHSKLKVKRK